MPQWIIDSTRQSHDKLRYEAETPDIVVDHNDVLVRFKAASLNYRDTAILNGQYLFPSKPTFVPLSDGAGVVEAVGSQVRLWAKGDLVMPIFASSHLSGRITDDCYRTALGGPRDGVMRSLGTFNEHSLVRIPDNYNFVQASTLPYAAATAWSCLYGLKGRRLVKGQWLLIQEADGVALFALQFAKAEGAHVVAIASSPEDAQRLKDLGADHVLDDTANEEWGMAARALTENQAGFHHIIYLTGASALPQTFDAICTDGVISIVGFDEDDGDEYGHSFFDVVKKSVTVRAVFAGSREEFNDMAYTVQQKNIKPVIDDRIFPMDKLQAAYKYYESQMNFGKVCIEIE